jgi:hypothetical protein
MKPIEEFEAIAEEIFSVYLDATEGFRQIAKMSEIFVNDKARETGRDEKGVSPAGHVIYALGCPEDGNYMELSARTGKEIIEANAPDGKNFQFIASMAIVALYQYWEDHYREEIAAFLGKDKNALTLPIFGDLRKFRRAIIHNRGRMIPELKTLEVFVWEHNSAGDDRIGFGHENICAIWWEVKKALKKLTE